jgi:hypothetical protein
VIAVTGNDDNTYCYDTRIHGGAEMEKADKYFAENIVKFLLWSRGGNKIAICGDEKIAAHIKDIYKAGGKRGFDYHFMSRVYEKEFQVLSLPLDEVPEEKEASQNIGRHLAGCRIGFDAGGSDRKVSAVIDGVSVYSEEVVWFPKTEENPDYHYDEILKAFQTAASKMPRVDAIGVSSAGIYIGNKTMIASLFLKVPEDRFDEKVKNIYERAARQIGENIPLVVANDGDVYTSGSGKLVRFDVKTQKLETLNVPVATVPGREVYNRVDAWTKDEAGSLYGGTSDGYLFRFDPERRRMENLGKPLNQYRIRGLVTTAAGKLYGIGGDTDEMARLFSYDPARGVYKMLGMIDVNRRPYYSWQGYVFDSMAIGADGTVYMGQAERKSKLYLFYPN